MASRRFLIRGNYVKVALFLAMMMVMPWTCKVCRDLWRFYTMDLLPPDYVLDSEKPTGINLALGMALLFKDEKGQCGYFYLTKRDRNSIDYCLVLSSPIQTTMSEGKICLWKWILRQHHVPRWIVSEDTYSFENYFFWIPNGCFLFNGNLQKVALVPVGKMDRGSICLDQVGWITPGKPDY